MLYFLHFFKNGEKDEQELQEPRTEGACIMSRLPVLRSSLALQFPSTRDTAPAGQRHVRDCDDKANPTGSWREVKPQETKVGHIVRPSLHLFQPTLEAQSLTLWIEMKSGPITKGNKDEGRAVISTPNICNVVSVIYSAGGGPT